MNSAENFVWKPHIRL